MCRKLEALLCIVVALQLLIFYAYFSSISGSRGKAVKVSEQVPGFRVGWRGVGGPAIASIGHRVTGDEAAEEGHYLNTSSVLAKKIETNFRGHNQPHGNQSDLDTHYEQLRRHWNQWRCGGNSDGTNNQPEWSPQGYVVIHRDWEQLTSAAANLLDLQCLAPLLGLVPVEPWLGGTAVHSSSHMKESSKTIRLSEIFDLELLNRRAIDRCYAPLARWDELESFVPHASVLVFVDIIYADENRDRCHFMATERHWATWLSGWSGITEHVCLDLRQSDPLTPLELKSALLGRWNHSDSSVVVIIQEWRGVRLSGSSPVGSRSPRLVMTDTKCSGVLYKYYSVVGRSLHNPLVLVPALDVWRDAETYATRYISSQDNTSYLAVVVHLEHIVKLDSAKHCFGRIILHMNELRMQTGVRDVFISVDTGQVGSSHTPPETKQTDSDNITSTQFTESLFRNINSDTLEAFEMSLVQSVSQAARTATTTAGLGDTTTSGGVNTLSNHAYMSTLQKAIAANAVCLLLVGGGQSQAHTLHLYSKQRRKERQVLCYTVMSASCEVKQNVLQGL